MDHKEFEHLCELAKLELSPEETAEFENKFNRLLGFVEQVQAYQPASDEAPLTLIDKMKPRRDTPRITEWPEGTKHEYRVPQIIDFEGDG